MVFNGDEAEKIMGGQKDSMFNTEKMLSVSEIRDKTLILKDGGLRAILKVHGLNLDLKNYEEKKLAVQKYKKFLNGLDFPIQILVRNTYLELTDYLDYMEDNIDNIENEVLQWQGEKYMDFLDNINSKQGLIYTKEFYIIVPFYVSKIDKDGVRKSWRKKLLNSFTSDDTPEKIVSRMRKFIKNRKKLDRRCRTIQEGLSGVGVGVERLGVSDIVSLLFKVYNPTSHENQSDNNS